MSTLRLALTSLIQQDPSIRSSAGRLKAVLRDVAPHAAPTEISGIITAAELQLIDTVPLASDPNALSGQALIDCGIQIAQRLEQDAGMREDIARHVAEVWLVGLGYPHRRLPLLQPTTSTNSWAVPIATAPSTEALPSSLPAESSAPPQDIPIASPVMISSDTPIHELAQHYTTLLRYVFAAVWFIVGVAGVFALAFIFDATSSEVRELGLFVFPTANVVGVYLTVRLIESYRAMLPKSQHHQILLWMSVAAWYCVLGRASVPYGSDLRWMQPILLLLVPVALLLRGLWGVRAVLRQSGCPVAFLRVPCRWFLAHGGSSRS